MSPKDLAKIFLTAILGPTAAYIAINGSNHGDGSQVMYGIAIVTLLGGMWGFPTDGPGNKGDKGGGSHAA